MTTTKIIIIIEVVLMKLTKQLVRTAIIALLTPIFVMIAMVSG